MRAGAPADTTGSPRSFARSATTELLAAQDRGGPSARPDGPGRLRAAPLHQGGATRHRPRGRRSRRCRAILCRGRSRGRPAEGGRGLRKAVRQAREVPCRSYVGAIDQGTTSTTVRHPRPAGPSGGDGPAGARQIYPEARMGRARRRRDLGRRPVAVIAGALAEAGHRPAATWPPSEITNQRETTVLWDRSHRRTGRTGHRVAGHPHRRPVPPTGRRRRRRTASATRPACRSPPTSPAPRLAWLLDHIEGLRERAEAGEILFGTIDTWLLWNLTGRHITDVTNASRTLLMDLRDPRLGREHRGRAFGIPLAMLPEIVPSVAVYGEGRGPLEGVPIAGCAR